MMRTNSATAIGAVFSFLAIFGSIHANAASSSVSISIHFAVAPADLFRARSIEPAKVRSCETLKERIETSWDGHKRGPVVRCSSPADMPLIVTDESDSTLIVRP